MAKFKLIYFLKLIISRFVKYNFIKYSKTCLSDINPYLLNTVDEKVLVVLGVLNTKNKSPEIQTRNRKI